MQLSAAQLLPFRTRITIARLDYTSAATRALVTISLESGPTLALIQLFLGETEAVNARTWAVFRLRSRTYKSFFARGPHTADRGYYLKLRIGSGQMPCWLLPSDGYHLFS